MRIYVKLRWCRSQDLLGAQIPVTTGGSIQLQFETWLEAEISQQKSATPFVR